METETKCKFCDKALAIFGLLLGAAFIFMSADILFGSKMMPRLIEGDDTSE